MYTIVETKQYQKKLDKFIKRHSDLLQRYVKTIHTLEKDPHHPSLRLHPLRGRMAQYYSVSINMSYRIVINFMIKDNKIILLDIGSHDEVYF